MPIPKTYYDKFWSPAFDTMEEFVFLVDTNFIVIRANQFFLNSVNKTQEEVLGQKCHRVVHGIEGHIPECPHAKTLETGKFEKQEIYDPGSKKWLYVRTTPIFDDNNKLIGSIHLAADVTDRNYLENEKNILLATLNERIKELQCLYGLSKIVETPDITLSRIFQEVANLLPSGLYHPDKAYARIVFENQEFKSHNFLQTEAKFTSNLFLQDHLAGVVEIYYLPSETNNDKPPFLKEETELIEAIAERLSRIIQREMIQQQYNVASEELRKQAQSLWETNLEIKTLYDELAEKNRKLQELDLLKSDFIATVSHELRTPLVPIRESVALILDGLLGETSEQQKKALSVGLRNIDRLTRLINDLLDLSKIEAGKLNLALEETDLTTVIENTAATFIGQAKTKGLELKTTIPQGMSTVYVDKDKITQVLSNLIGNSLKFTPQGQVEISVKDAGEFMECSVSDTGPGINPKDLPYLFDKFQQFNADSFGLKGTGLGLAISKGLIKAHGGEISAANNPDLGITFRFTLPKYDRKKALLDSIDYQIAFAENASAKMQMLLIRLDNHPELLELIGQEQLRETKASFQRSVKQILPQPNVIEQNAENEIAIFIPYKPEKADMLVKKIKRELKSAFFNLEKSPQIEFSLAKSIYPNDGYSAEVLLEKSGSYFISEKLERQSRTILLVDDEELLIRSMKLFLKQAGYNKVISAATGQEALDKVKDSSPSIIVLDIKMPGMNGYEVLGRLKENPATKEIPVIIMSGFTVEMGKIQDYLKEQSIITISKPFDSASILKLIDYLI